MTLENVAVRKGKFFIPTILLLGLLTAPALWADETAVQFDTVTLQLKWKHQFQFAGYYVAKEKGFYKAAGLDVNIVEAAPGIDPIQEVITGRAQFGVGTSELILNRYRGEPVLVLGVIFQHSPLALVTLAKTKIDNIHKLVGHNVMIEPSSAELFAYLYQEGFTKKAFELQHHSFDLNDLLTGKTDAMSVYITDEVYLLQQQKQAYNQFSPGMSGIDFYGDNFFTLESELEQNPQRVKAFREATLRGWRYAMQNPEEVIQLIYQRYSKRHSLEHLRFEAKAMYDLMQPELIDPGYMNAGRWQHIAHTYHELGLLPERFNVAAMLYFPNSAVDMEKLKIRLYYAAAGLSLLILVIAVLFRFYRQAHISQTRLKIMFDNAPLGLIVLDGEDRVQSWNAAAEKTFLWKTKEIIGKHVSLLVSPSYRKEVEEVLETVHKYQTISQHENPNLKKDGQEIICEWINAPFKSKYDKTDFMICMARDITEKKLLEQKLEQAAHYDNLTGLANRALILEHLKQALALAARHKMKVALLFLDLNGFKQVNDTLGHDAGDLLLQTIAQRLPLAIRESDYVGRLGGDEFLVILQDIGSFANAKTLAEKVQKLVCQPCMLKDQQVTISTSVGISLYPDDATEINSLINQADQGMYQDKQGRRSKHALN